MYYIYVLQSRKNRDLYIGYSKDLRKRYRAHNDGRVKSTKGYRPWELIYYEAYRAKEDANKREYELKISCNKEKLRLKLDKSMVT